MSTLILTCNTGEGHNSCAKAIKEVYDTKGAPCEIVDALTFVSEGFSAFVNRVHTSLYLKHPKLFSWGYDFIANHTRTTIAEHTIPYKILELGIKRMHDYIVQNNISHVICVHSMLALMLTAMQEKYHVNCRTAFVATDYTCSPGVKDSRPQLCFVPDSSLKSEFYCANIQSSQVIPCGIPVRQQFYAAVDKALAKNQFDIPKDAAHLVMMCGSMGCGPMEEILEQLCSASFHITVVCGTNQTLQQSLQEKYHYAQNIHVRGFVTEMSVLLDSADAVLIKPGGLSSTEAAVKGIPMIFVNAVAGCESYNLRFFTRSGGAVTGETPVAVAELCMDIMNKPERRENMSTALHNMQIPNASNIIFEHMAENKPEFQRW